MWPASLRRVSAVTANSVAQSGAAAAKIAGDLPSRFAAPAATAVPVHRNPRHLSGLWFRPFPDYGSLEIG